MDETFDWMCNMHKIFCLIVHRRTARPLCTCGCSPWCIDGRSDISTLYCANEDDNDEWDSDDLEGGEDGRDNNCGYLPVQSRCSGAVVAPFAFPHNHKWSLSWTHLTLAHKSTAHQLARCHRTAFVWPINSRCRRTADSHPRSSIPGSSTGPTVLWRHQSCHPTPTLPLP